MCERAHIYSQVPLIVVVYYMAKNKITNVEKSHIMTQKKKDNDREKHVKMKYEGTKISS